MAAYNRVNGSFCTAHRELLVEILEQEWGFDGVVVSDETLAQRVRLLRQALDDDSQNPRYVQRAVEICILSGRPASELRRSFSETASDLRGILLEWDSAALETRIRARTSAMLRSGAIAEVEALPPEAATASKAIGVTEIRRHLAGETDLADCEERIVIATRRYAKRQRTWFRREKWLTPIEGNASLARILASLPEDS